MPPSAGASIGAEGIAPSGESALTRSPARTKPFANLPAAAVARPEPSSKERGDAAVQFAKGESVRLARLGTSVSSGANELLRWTSRRRAVIEVAAAQLRSADDLDAAVRATAVAIVERALVNGLLF